MKKIIIILLFASCNVKQKPTFNPLPTGNYNCMIGKCSGYSLTNGSFNIFSGPNSGRDCTSCTGRIIITDSTGKETCNIINPTYILILQQKKTIDSLTYLLNK